MIISGSIGITILKKEYNNGIKYILLFSDKHAEVLYCDKNSITITEFLKENMTKHQVLLEEVPRVNNVELEQLWSGEKHTMNLKNLYLENKYLITPVDLRPLLLPVSFELIDLNRYDFVEFTIGEYLNTLDEFFSLEGIVFKKFFTPLINNLEIRRSGIDKFLTRLYNNYSNIKKRINLNKTVIYYLDNRYDILQLIDDIYGNIIEFYTLLHIFQSYELTIIHMGLYHTSSILKSLTNDCNFEILYQHGQNKLVDIKTNISCVEIPNEKLIGIF